MAICNKKITINIILGIFAFVINTLVSFFLSPYIVKTIGVEANGFVTLANNFVSYANLVTIALNSMAGRFIAIEYHKGNVKKANEYYTSVFIGNLLIVTIFLIPVIIFIMKLESLINIPNEMITDVKILFGCVFAEFLIVTGVPNWVSATYVTNNLYLDSFRETLATFFRALTIIIGFTFFSPHVYYIGIAALVLVVYRQIYAYIYKCRLTPDLNIQMSLFKFKTALKLVESGMWNTITRIGTLLRNGLDILITNLFIGSTEMGLMSIAKTVPGLIIGLSTSVTSVFAPNLVKLYANNDLESIKKELKYGMKISGVISSVPTVVFIVFGREFFYLWVPSVDIDMLYILSILSSLVFVFISSIRCLYNVFSVTNKLRTNSILNLISGLINIVIVYVLLKNTQLGVYAVAGVSTLIEIVFNLFYDVPFTAKYLKLKWNTFCPEVITSIISVFVSIGVGLIYRWVLIKYVFIVNTWIKLFASCALFGIIVLCINILIILNKDERIKFYKTIRGKIGK